jgi:hypothetical protein
VISKVLDEALGIGFEIDGRFESAGFPRDDELPTAHYIASEPGAGRVAALAIVTVRAEPLPAEEWLALQVARARAAFGGWPAEAHEMLVAPGAAALAGRPAVHIRYRLLPRDAGGAPAPERGAGDADDADDAVSGDGRVPASLVEQWTMLVAERRWLLAMELMVQPPAWWGDERSALELPFRTLELL